MVLFVSGTEKMLNKISEGINGPEEGKVERCPYLEVLSSRALGISNIEL